MRTYTHNSKYFYGHEISEHGQQYGYLDYRTLAQAFDAVRVNDIDKLFYSTVNNEYIEPEQVNGYIDNSDEIDGLQTMIDDLELFNENGEHDNDIAEYQERIDALQAAQDYPPEIFQYYIISDNGAEILKEFTDDPVFYIDYLDMYVWGVTHWGTAWDYVLTDVRLELDND